MKDERRRILDLLAAGKITADEAEKLLEAVTETGRPEPDSQITETGKPAPKYLRIQVEPTGDARNGGERVNIRVPLKLVKTGIKLGSLLPDSARGRVNEALGEKGIKIDVGKLDGEAVDELLSALTSLSIDVDDEKEKVRIFCE